MNERIQELYEQAQVIDLAYDKWGDPIDSKRLDPEKFAELIIRECARISEEEDDTMTNQGAASAQAFKQHFGVN